jgi:hypothetical protein
MKEAIKVPKYLEERFDRLEAESELIEDCKYILYFAKGWALGDFPDVPVKSKKEAIKYLKDANKYNW